MTKIAGGSVIAFLLRKTTIHKMAFKSLFLKGMLNAFYTFLITQFEVNAKRLLLHLASDPPARSVLLPVTIAIVVLVERIDPEHTLNKISECNCWLCSSSVMVNVSLVNVTLLEIAKLDCSKSEHDIGKYFFRSTK